MPLFPLDLGSIFLEIMYAPLIRQWMRCSRCIVRVFGQLRFRTPKIREEWRVIF